MKRQKSPVGWVVYKTNNSGPQGGNAVCKQSEWESIRQVEPGRYTLVRDGIATEAEAERVARESPGGTAAQQVTRLKARPR
jgi:hypothetical protein